MDMDEVIADAYQAHIDLFAKAHGEQFTKAQCEGHEFWHMVPEQHQNEVRQHADQIGFFRDLKVIPDSQEVLAQLNEKHDLYIASAAMQFPNSLKEKSDWLDEYFPFIPWQRRILCGHKHILKGDVLIDDRAYNLQRFDGRAILFSSPHNAADTVFERAASWKAVASLLL